MYFFFQSPGILRHYPPVTFADNLKVYAASVMDILLRGFRIRTCHVGARNRDSSAVQQQIELMPVDTERKEVLSHTNKHGFPGKTNWKTI